ncbi:mechanosensitive ion channel [Marinobacter halodurans]|uniref:Mechanosensitive ion channel n=2 Tax=Marinobacter halodurans TaxID=2528979 RepID=A0ABY1ZK27_9GAMM|nr:mechanosensitive ion channel [Marinobacter halodurans]
MLRQSRLSRRQVSPALWLLRCLLLLVCFSVTTAHAQSALTELLPHSGQEKESSSGNPDKQESGDKAAQQDEASDASQENDASGDSQGKDGKDQTKEEEPPPKPSPNPVQPAIDDDVGEPLQSQLPSAQTADIRQQIQSLRNSLDDRLGALERSRDRLAYADSLLKRLDDEYKTFELRLEKAGLNLTDDYARLLRQRLDRLRRQTIAEGLTEGIRDQLSAAREEQLRLEEYEAIMNPDNNARGRLRQKRADLLRQLHKAVTDHIEVLDDYYSTVTQLRDRVDAYQELLQQRLFWLPSAEVVGKDTFSQLYQALTWFVSSLQWSAMKTAISASINERGFRMAALILAVVALLIKRRTIRKALIDSGEYVGNVGRDQFPMTLMALLYSLLLSLPGVLLLSFGTLLIKEGNEFFGAISKGFGAAAFIMLLLNLVHKVARQAGLGERHFKWNPKTLQAIRREIPILMAVLIPITIIMPTLETADGSVYRDSLGRILFLVASAALASFAHRSVAAVRHARTNDRTLRLLHLLAVGTPLLLALASLMGYHYTAVQLEGSLFISICWLAFVTLLYYLGLRGLSVRERRLTLERLLEQRANERRMAEAREAAESTGEGVPPALDMPEMNLKDISQQSTSLLRILALAIAATGLWFMWKDVIPALQLFDNVTLWSISTGADSEDLPITLGDVLVALLFVAGTIVAAKNLPGTLEVMILSRLNLEPGAGYAITTLATYIIVFIGVTVSLAVLGVQWSKLQWLVAALGVGLGFGLQEIVANFVSGIILLFERPIRVGDTVTIDGITGTVTRIRIRATTLMDWDRKEQIIPNKTFVTQDLTNWTLSDPITRVIIRVGVAYGSDVDKVRDVLYRVTLDNERVVEDPAPAVFCVGLGDSSINFEIRAFVRDLMDFMPLSHELHSTITRALREAGVEIPFPQRDIHIRTAAPVQPTGSMGNPMSSGPDTSPEGSKPNDS